MLSFLYHFYSARVLGGGNNLDGGAAHLVSEVNMNHFELQLITIALCNLLFLKGGGLSGVPLQIKELAF